MRSFSVTLLGVPIAVDTDPTSVDDSLHGHLRALWGQCLTDGVPVARVFVALGLHTKVPAGYLAYARGGDGRELAAQLSDVLIGSAMAQLAASEGAAEGHAVLPPALGVCACAVADERGQPAAAVALLGDASTLGGGRRTAVMTALAERFGYLSDAAIAVDLAGGAVLAAQKPLSVFETARLRSRREETLEGAGLRPVEGPAVLRSFVFLERRTEPGPSGWEPLSVPEAAARLAPAVPYFPALPHPMQDLAALVGLVGSAVRVRYRDEQELPMLLEEILAADADLDLVLPIDTSVDERSVPARGAIRRVSVLDGVTDGSAMALCRLDRTPVAIAGIAPHLWDMTRSWITPQDLTAQLTARLGVPDDLDPSAAIGQAVEQLIDEKILARLD